MTRSRPRSPVSPIQLGRRLVRATVRSLTKPLLLLFLPDTYKTDRPRYEATAREWTRKYAM
jgi:hypothetical protein